MVDQNCVVVAGRVAKKLGVPFVHISRDSVFDGRLLSR